mgnify:CR=1 FL=1
MKYITILEAENIDCPNVGTITTVNTEESFKEAIESHFDGEMVEYSFENVDTVNDLIDCIDAVPIDVFVEIDNIDSEVTNKYKVSLSQTWLYQF